MTTHTDTEKLRLDAGMENCGCPECQRFYKTLDLSKYGGRVKTFGDVIIINARSVKKVEEVKEKTEKPEKAPTTHLPKPSSKQQDAPKPMLQNVIKEKHRIELCNIEKLQYRGRGRHFKVGTVHRSTDYRRRMALKNQKQVVLL